MNIFRNPVQSSGTNKEVQITDNNGGFTSSVIQQSGNDIIPTTDSATNLGSATNRFDNLFLDTIVNVDGSLNFYSNDGGTNLEFTIGTSLVSVASGNNFRIANGYMYFSGTNDRIGSASTNKIYITNRQSSFRSGNLSENYGFVIGNGIETAITPDVNAILKLESTTQGFLIPVMNNTELLLIPDTVGLLAYDTDSQRPYFNDGNSWKGFGDLHGLFSQIAQSTTITNTTTPTSIIASGVGDFVGSLTVPANGFLIGDSFHAKIGGVISAQNNDTITIDIEAGGVTLASTGAITLEAVTSLGWEMEIDFTIASLGTGGSGSGEICTNGNFAYNRDTGSLEGFVFQDVQNINTTISNTLDIIVTWGQAKTQDQIYSANFVLNRTYKA